MHGKGAYTYADGSKYSGEFRKGVKNGHGMIRYADGDTYIGEWKHGQKNGQGTYTHANGRVQKGIWEMGLFKYAQKVSPPATAKKSPTPPSSVNL